MSKMIGQLCSPVRERTAIGTVRTGPTLPLLWSPAQEKKQKTRWLLLLIFTQLYTTRQKKMNTTISFVSVSSDGKVYDAYVSYVNNDHDRKFVNFILKPHLEKKLAHKLHLNDNDILPGSGEAYV